MALLEVSEKKRIKVNRVRFKINILTADESCMLTKVVYAVVDESRRASSCTVRGQSVTRFSQCNTF